MIWAQKQYVPTRWLLKYGLHNNLALKFGATAFKRGLQEIILLPIPVEIKNVSRVAHCWEKFGTQPLNKLKLFTLLLCTGMLRLPSNIPTSKDQKITKPSCQFQTNRSTYLHNFVRLPKMITFLYLHFAKVPARPTYSKPNVQYDCRPTQF